MNNSTQHTTGYFKGRTVFWLGLRTISLLLTITLLPVSILHELGDHKNIAAFIGISFSLIINVYGLSLLLGKNTHVRKLYCAPFGRAVLDSIVFCCFCFASAVFIRTHLHDPSPESSSSSSSFLFNQSFPGEDVPIAAVYLGLALSHITMAIYDCIEALEHRHEKREAAKRAANNPISPDRDEGFIEPQGGLWSPAIDLQAPMRTHQAVRAQRVWV